MKFIIPRTSFTKLRFFRWLAAMDIFIVGLVIIPAGLVFDINNLILRITIFFILNFLLLFLIMKLPVIGSGLKGGQIISRCVNYLLARKTKSYSLPINYQDKLVRIDNGNYRMGEKVMYAKGLIYGDMIKVVTDLSTIKKPLAFETKLVNNRKFYNSHYGFEDNNIVVPDTIEGLRKN